MKQMIIALPPLSINLKLMGAQIKTQTIINASPERIWSILTTYSKYGEWNPFILSIKGPIAEEEKIEVTFKEMKFKPTLKKVIPHRKLEWLGHLLIPGIFDGRHKFELIDNMNGTTTFIQSEDFKGLLVTIMKKKLIGEYTPKFQSMNKALKARAEQ